MTDFDPFDIASRARAYDPEALAALFDAFFEKIRRFAYFHTGDAHLADDLASEVFSQALESIGKFTDRGGTIGPWLFGIARNVVAAHFRSTGARPTVPLDETARAPDSDCPEERALLKLSHEELYQALSALPDEQRTIVVLRFIEGVRREDRGTGAGQEARCGADSAAPGDHVAEKAVCGKGRGRPR